MQTVTETLRKSANEWQLNGVIKKTNRGVTFGFNNKLIIRFRNLNIFISQSYIDSCDNIMPK